MTHGATFRTFAAQWLPRVEAALDALLPAADAEPAALHAAMRYAMFPGGKRLRPMLALAAAQVTGGDPERALRPAAAIECLHTYSLVHDDLPCMDDDDLRRGRPTCHIVHGEAMAVLAGDALLTLAFEGAAAGGAEAVAALARAAGSFGMVGGQAADLAAEGLADPTLAQVRWIHDHKTARLIAGSLLVGAHSGAGGRALAEGTADRLEQFGMKVGLAFQIADDCLDLTGTAAELGKTPGADLALDKLTWPKLLGLEASIAMARSLAAEAAALVPAIAAAAAGTGHNRQAELDAAIKLLQDVAFHAVERRN